jgi:hypothetical protein
MCGSRKPAANGACLWAACLLATLFPVPPLKGAPPLRYHLAVGDRLVYERRVRVSPLEEHTAPEYYTEQLQLWCLASENNEVLVLGDLVRRVDGQAETTHGGLFHVGPRGRRRFSSEMLARTEGLDPLFELIPILPPALQDEPVWLTEPDHFGRCWRCTRAASDPAADGLVRVDFVLEDPTGVADACRQTQRGSYWFDPQAGIVVRVESELQDRSAKRGTLSVTRLYTRLKLDPLWCAQRLEEANRFLCTLRLEDRLLDEIATQPDQIERILPRIDRLWSELIRGMRPEPGSPFRRLAQARRTALAGEAERYRQRAELTREWLGKLAAHWSLQTPDGDTIRSEAVRDRLVVEYFWSADSLWSLRSFQVLREIQERLPAEEFRVVCVNIDADVEAGRRVARLCGAGLTHVLAGSPVGGEPPRELPVFRILDRDSRVLGIYFGWQPALAGRIAALRR